MKKCTLLVMLVAWSVAAFGQAAELRHSFVVTTEANATGRRGPLVHDMDVSADSSRHFARFHIVEGYTVDLTDTEAAELRQQQGVNAVTPTVERHIMASGDAAAIGVEANQPRDLDAQTMPYGIALVNATGAWAATHGDGINVVVLDTGIDYTHPEFQGIYQGGYNTITSTEDPRDDNGHGTHCAGIIAAADNSSGVVGVAPHVKLWSVKVLGSDGSGSDAQILHGIDWVVQKKAAIGGDWIISMSLGASKASPTEKVGISNAIAAGILFVAASGNDSTASTPAPVSYPAAYPNVLAIGALDSTSKIADFSNQGPEIALAAPGVDVLSTLRVGTGSYSSVRQSNNIYYAPALTGSANGTLTGKVVYCGLGNTSEFPAEVKGNIALIKRGDLTFNQKTKNAIAAGASAVIIFNKDDSSLAFTLIGQSCNTAGTVCTDLPADLSYPWPVVLSISNVDGATLQASAPTITMTNKADDYGYLSGTSMATPHVAGVAALVWSLAPTATADQIRTALVTTAKDLGVQGQDPVYGFGLVDALAASKLVAPNAFGTGASVPPVPSTPTGRRLLTRGGH
jgi:serine protease